MQTRKKAAFFRGVVAALCAALPLLASSAVMQSTSYKIQADSVNTGGGLGSSASYKLENTAGESATGQSSSASYTLSAGYQQMSDVSISITSPTDISLPHINGLNGGTATSSATWTVITDDPAGYTLTVRAATSPAFKASTNGSYFSDYVPAGNPDFSYTLLSTASTFGFSPEGSDIIQKYKDNGSICNAGSGDTVNSCWDGFSTVDKTVAASTLGNTPSGTATTLKFEAGSGSAKIQDSGTYSASITVTATAL